MDADLPNACIAGEPDCCRNGDIVIPPERWSAIALYLDLWAQYPDQCRDALDESNNAWQRIVESERRVARAMANANTIDNAVTMADTWPSWQAWALAGVVGGLALILGYVSGWIVGEFTD